MIKLGVNTVLFGDHDLRTAMECIKWAGYNFAEISALGGMANHLPLDDWRNHAGDIRALVEELELPLTAVEVGTNVEEPLTLGFEAAAEIGIPVVNVGPGANHAQDNAEDMARLIDHTNAMAAKAEQFGVTLCMKAHVRTSLHNTPTTLEVMAGVSSPAFGIDMDPSHIHRSGEVPKEALAQVISRVRHIHIRDCDGPGPPPGTPEMQACGRGEIDLMGYCQVMADSGYDGPVNLEIIGAKEYDLTSQAIIAAESHGYLNACLTACGAEVG
jgi:sugar phosphate isomerase/epimerase